jgi:hypothetical protein
LDGNDTFQSITKLFVNSPDSLLIIITPTLETTRVLMANGLEKEETGFKIVQQKACVGR